MGTFFCLGALVVVYLIGKSAGDPESEESSVDGQSPAVKPPPIPVTPRDADMDHEPVAPSPVRRAFELYRDARTEEGRFDGGYLSFSSSRLAARSPSIVTGLTFEAERLYVLRGQGVTIFRFDSTLTVAVINGRPGGFQEPASFSMILSSDSDEAEARFPLSFAGWLEVIDQARSSGAVIEMEEDLPDRLKELIAEPLFEDENVEPVRIRPSAGTSAASAVRTKCSSCGANLGGLPRCDFCGVRG